MSYFYFKLLLKISPEANCTTTRCRPPTFRSLVTNNTRGGVVGMLRLYRRTRTGYSSPLSERYASQSMLALWSPQRRYGLWRRLWLALAECERDLGVPIPADAIAQMRDHLDDIDFDVVATYEKRYGQTDVSYGVHNYNIPRGDRFPFGVRGATVELFGRAEYDMQNGWFPLAELRVDVDEADGWYAFVGCAKSIPINDKFTFEAQGTVAYIDPSQAFFDYAVRESGLADGRVTAKLFYQFDAATRFTLLAAYSTMIDQKFRDSFDANRLATENAWISTGVNWSY